jgi:glycosyltransferase involved in cell wall biosynthesis
MDDSILHKLLIIGSVWPEPSSSAAGQRMLQIMECFQRDGWKITFTSAAAKGDRAVDFSSGNIETQLIKINDSSANEFLKILQPDAVLFDRFITEEQFGWRVAEYCPDTLRILDTEDLHCLRRARRKALNEGRDFFPRDLLLEETTKREVAGIFRCDLSLIISEYEYQLLTDLFPIDERLLHYLPLLFEPVDECIIQSWPEFEERRHFVTIGNFRHQPNWDSIHYLNQSIWPGIRGHLPDAEMHIYGAYPPKKAKSLNQPENGFYIEGQIDGAKKVVQQARVLLAPLRFGAGLKGKLTEAMRCGTPSVTTPIGAEGLQSDMRWSGFVEKKPKKFIDAAVKLYSQKSLWEKAQRRGIEIINKRFAKESFQPALMKRIKKVQQALSDHRCQNFIGSMLMHHTTAGTKYMARWIEAKKAADAGRETGNGMN